MFCHSLCSFVAATAAAANVSFVPWTRHLWAFSNKVSVWMRTQWFLWGGIVCACLEFDEFTQSYERKRENMRSSVREFPPLFATNADALCPESVLITDCLEYVIRLHKHNRRTIYSIWNEYKLYQFNCYQHKPLSQSDEPYYMCVHSWIHSYKSAHAHSNTSSSKNALALCYTRLYNIVPTYLESICWHKSFDCCYDFTGTNTENVQLGNVHMRNNSDPLRHSSIYICENAYICTYAKNMIAPSISHSQP